MDDSSGEKPGFSTEAALRALEDRLERASDAAERLIADAARAAARTPPAGWAAPTDPPTHSASDPRSPEGVSDGDGMRGGDEVRGRDGVGSEHDVRAGNDARAGEGQNDDDLATGLAFVRSLRDLIPPDLQRRLAEALRELLLAVRALVDWYLERLDQRRRSPPPVEDIPIL